MSILIDLNLPEKISKDITKSETKESDPQLKQDEVMCEELEVEVDDEDSLENQSNQ